jgi:hypothetical protein
MFIFPSSSTVNATLKEAEVSHILSDVPQGASPHFSVTRRDSRRRPSAPGSHRYRRHPSELGQGRSMVLVTVTSPLQSDLPSLNVESGVLFVARIAQSVQ